MSRHVRVSHLLMSSCTLLLTAAGGFSACLHILLSIPFVSEILKCIDCYCSLDGTSAMTLL